MTMRRTRYSQQDKERFFHTLQRYREALRTRKGIVRASLEIHIALASVPNSYKRFVNQAFREMGHENPPQPA